MRCAELIRGCRPGQKTARKACVALHITFGDGIGFTLAAGQLRAGFRALVLPHAHL